MKALAIGFVLAAALGAYAAWTPRQHGEFDWNIFAGIALWGTVLLAPVVDFVLGRPHRRSSRFATAHPAPWWVILIGWGIAVAICLPLIALADLILTRAGVCEGWIEYHRYSGIFVCRRMAGILLIFTLVGAVLAVWGWARGRS